MWVFLVLLSFMLLDVNAQGYMLTEGFSNAAETDPPSGWRNVLMPDDQSAAVWHFDNPADRSLAFPMVPPFAIFDTDLLDGYSGRAVVALETRTFQAASVETNNYLLMFDHRFLPGPETTVSVQAYNGSAWIDVRSWTDETANPRREIIDISDIVGGVSSARIRFIWSGEIVNDEQEQGFWAIDNVRIYAAWPVDAGLVQVSSPAMPFDRGSHQVFVTLGNFGSLPLGSTTLRWKFDDGPVQEQLWVGVDPLGFGETTEVPLGAYDFDTAVELHVWQDSPNGEADANPDNDEVVRMLSPRMEGAYTIGHTGADFSGFGDAVAALLRSGVSGPVVFNVFEGDYDERITITPVDGASDVNTITFVSDDANASLPRLASTLYLQTALSLRGASFLRFDGVEFSGYNAVVLEDHANNISFDRCRFTAVEGGVHIRTGSHQIQLTDNAFFDAASLLVVGHDDGDLVHDVMVYNNQFSNALLRAMHLDGAKGIHIVDNTFDNNKFGIFARDAEELEVTKNLIHVAAAFGFENTGIRLEAISNARLYNNFISSRGQAMATGIRVVQSLSAELFFNSVHITNTDVTSDSKALRIDEGNQDLNIQNNIFNIAERGYPVYIEGPVSGVILDHNNYFSQRGLIGRVNENNQNSIQDWQDATGQDGRSVSENPFFASLTDYTISQSLLDGAANPVLPFQIPEDISGSARDLSGPTIGAWEFDPCPVDAGINGFASPGLVASGVTGDDIVVILHNHGTAVLNTVTIYWEVTGGGVSDGDSVNLMVDLPPGTSTDMLLVNDYLFPSGVVSLRAWTGSPNSQVDCNTDNDAFQIMVFGALCGEYTIGGADGDFPDFRSAIEALNAAGISCDVVFHVRDGDYHEQIVIRDIRGTEDHRITFQSENGSAATRIVFSEWKQAPVRIRGAENIHFHGIGFVGHYALLIEDWSENLGFENCFFSVYDIPVTDDKQCVKITNGASRIRFSGNYFDGGYYAINIPPGQGARVSHIDITNNHFQGTFHDAIIVNPADHLLIDGNWFENIKLGVLSGSSHDLVISNNRFYIDANPDQENKNRGIYISQGTSVRIFNNFVVSMGTGATSGIQISQCSDSEVLYNSVNIANENVVGVNLGLAIHGGSDNQVQNNILQVGESGYPVWLEDTPVALTLDYNNYYSSDGAVGYSGTAKPDLDQWQSDTGHDQHSLSVNPFFAADGAAVLFGGEGPQINQVLLKDAGIQAGGILMDIKGDMREENPSVGAWEYAPEETDAGINGFTSPDGLVSGEQAVIVVLLNHGQVALQSVTIHWEINGQPLPPVSWSDGGTPLVSGESVIVELGSFPFESGLYGIRAWTEDPNGEQDQNPANDLSQISVVGGLCGDYMIGPEGDFSSFSDAVTVLNNAGITCDVVFTVTAAIYEEQFIIGDFYRTSDDLTVRFVAVSPDGESVQINAPPGTPFAAKLENTRHISFEGIGFRGRDAVIIDGQSSYIGFYGCHFRANPNHGVDIKPGCSHITFHDNTFISGAHSIFMRWEQILPIEHIEIAGNTFQNPVMEAIHAYGVNDLFIYENHFVNIRRGILAFETQSMLVRENWFIIQSSADQENMGMKIEESTQTSLYNNFIVGSGTDPVRGISMINNTQSSLFFNTINITNNNSLSRALYIDRGSGLSIKNNIFNIRQNGFPVYVMEMPVQLFFFYNNYHRQGSSLIGYAEGQAFNNLAGWRSVVNDEGSVNLNPNFSDVSSPVHQQPGLNNKAEALAEVSRDIFGVLRHPTSPDIGCYESFVDYGITELHIQALDCTTSHIGQVSVNLIQSGKDPLDSLRLFFQVNDGDIREEVITGFTDNEMYWTFSVDADLSEPGMYVFRAWLPDAGQSEDEPGSLGDQWFPNNEVTVTREKFPSPQVVIDFAYACDRISFFSDIDPDPSDPVDTAIWYFGNGESSLDASPEYAYDESGSYTVVFQVLTSSGCLVEEVIEVLAGEPGAEIHADAQVWQACPGEANGSIALDVGGATAPYFVSLNGSSWEENDTGQFLFADLVPDTYMLEVRDTLNCSTTLEVDVTEVPAVNPVINAPDHVYIPASVPFGFSSDHTGYGYVEWSLNGETSNDAEPDFFFDTAGTYTVTLEVFSGPSNQCIERVVHIIEAELMPLTLEVEVSQQYCQADDPPAITLLVDGGVPPYRIFVEGDEVATTSDMPWILPDPLPGQSYAIMVMDEYDQQQTSQVDLAMPVAMNPVIKLTDAEGIPFYDAYIEVLPFDVTFSMEYDDEPESWIWRIGTWSATTAEAVFVFDTPGEFLVELETTSGEPGACVEVAYFVVIVELRVEIATVDIMTPNGDGVDDYFEVIHKGLVSLEVDIFDRRGRQVYRIDDLDGRWNGDFDNGQAAPDGMYPYYLRAMGYDGLPYERTGMIQLIRDEILVYPNPAAGMVTIDPSGNLSGRVDIDVVDLRGHTALSVKGIEFIEIIELDISALQEGIYMIRIADQKNVFHSKLFVRRQ